MITVEQVYRSLASSHRHRIGVSPRSSVNRLADHLVDCGLDERGGDGLPDAAALPVVGDTAGVGGEVATKLAHRLGELGLGDVGLVGVGIVRLTIMTMPSPG